MSESDPSPAVYDVSRDPRFAGPIFSIRVSSQSYLSVLFLGTFFAALLFYLDLDAAALALFGVSWVILPYLALNDRIQFDGKRIWRTGLIPRGWAALSGARRRIKLSDVEQVETETVRAIKRGNDVTYRYRTALRSRRMSLAFVSGGDEYRRLMKSVLALVPGGALDYRSTELRDHLADPKETLMRAEFSRIPSSDMLASVMRQKVSRLSPRAKSMRPVDPDADAADLQSLGGELKVAGYLLPSLEAFRRALVVKPRDARVLFDFARCLYTIAGLQSDKALERRARAAVRLSARRAADDSELLLRLGEWHFQTGDWRHSAKTFQNVIERFGESFTAFRGLAELALRDGKIAHVIHHFAAAARTADTPSLARWSKREAEYFAHLNSDDTYMDMELSRISMADTVEASKKNVLRLAGLAMPLIVVGLTVEDELTVNLGWAVSTVALILWLGLSFAARMFARRISYDVVDIQD